MVDELSFLIGMVGVAVAGIATYIANRKLQDRAKSHEIAREIYAPLLNLLRQAESDDLNQLEHKFSIQKWKELRNNRLFYWVKEDIDEHLYSFQVNLHNFNVGLRVSINKIKKQMKDAIFKRIKEEKLDQLKRTQPLVDEYFWNQLAKIVLQRDEIGFLGGVDYFLKIRDYYDELGKDFKTEKVPFDDFVKGIASKFKDDRFLKGVKDKQKKLFGECRALQDEIRKQMGIKRKRWS